MSRTVCTCLLSPVGRDDLPGEAAQACASPSRCQLCMRLWAHAELQAKSALQICSLRLRLRPRAMLCSEQCCADLPDESGDTPVGSAVP